MNACTCLSPPSLHRATTPAPTHLLILLLQFRGNGARVLEEGRLLALPRPGAKGVHGLLSLLVLQVFLGGGRLVVVPAPVLFPATAAAAAGLALAVLRLAETVLELELLAPSSRILERRALLDLDPDVGEGGCVRVSQRGVSV